MLAGVNAALAAAAVGLLVVELITLLSWVSERRSAAPLSAALRTGAAFWLLGHGGRLHLFGQPAALLPLGLTLSFGLLAGRGGAAVARVRPAGPRLRTLLACALAVSVPYALIGALVAVLSSGGGLQTSVLTAAIGSFVLATVAASAGAARKLPLASPKRSAIRAVIAGVGAAGGLLFAASALLSAGALVTHLSAAAALAKPSQAGVVGGFGMFALQASLAPNVMLWTASYLLGPGFAVGAGTLVSPTSVHLGDLPGLPILSGLPADALAWPLYVIFLVPVAAGVLAGAVTVRRMARMPKPLLGASFAAAVGVGAGVLTGLLTALSGGPVTSGRLATVGPSAWQAGLAATLEIGTCAIVTAFVLCWRRQRARRLAGEIETAEIAAAQGPRAWLRGHRLRVRPPEGIRLGGRLKDRLEGFGTGLAAGVGIDRLFTRWCRTEPDAPRVDLTKRRVPQVVDLTKARVLPVVDLIKRPAAPQADEPVAPRRLRVPTRLRRRKRKDRVIRLPD